ncbi:MAG: hypothetical protein H0V82_11310 [Candidatus Protochlamydia sp.]|nr:hypothetical protein [Candidatus Protochlamydia sp.]
MNEVESFWADACQLLHEMVEGQHAKLLNCANRLVPHVTAEDILQPNDFPELENHPHFRYEEGVLAGIQSVQMALWALQKR